MWILAAAVFHNEPLPLTRISMPANYEPEP